MEGAGERPSHAKGRGAGCATRTPPSRVGAPPHSDDPEDRGFTLGVVHGLEDAGAVATAVLALVVSRLPKGEELRTWEGAAAKLARRLIRRGVVLAAHHPILVALVCHAGSSSFVLLVAWLLGLLVLARTSCLGIRALGASGRNPRLGRHGPGVALYHLAQLE